MKDPFPTGKVVRLKSGGPKMTVNHCAEQGYGANSNKMEVWCDWFAGSKKELGKFLPEQLEEVSETPKSGE